MKKFLLLIVLSFSFGQVIAQKTSLWQAQETSRISNLTRLRTNNVCEGELYFSLNLNEFKQSLANANDKFSNSQGVAISLPNTKGEIETYLVWENSNFEPTLQAQFPEIRSYVGKGITDKYATLNLSISPQGIQTIVFRANTGTEFIEAYDKQATAYILFNSSKRISGRLPFSCGTNDVALADAISDKVNNTTLSSSGNYKTFRLALSCTAEYSNFFGATSAANVALVLAGMNATMTRVNGVLEKDLSVHFNLIPTTDQVIYYNAATDPYSNAAIGSDTANANNATGWNIQLQNTLTSVLGNGAYDIGHLFGASGGGGNAGCIGCICTDDSVSTTDKNKGSGFTSPSDAIPQGDTFDIDYVVHEMGHQLGASHTFTYNYEGSGVQVEPGSGSTIMAYAGVADDGTSPAFNVQAHSDALYCYKSITQIQSNLAASGASCAVTAPLAGINATPTAANGGSAYTIPVSTAFKLTGVGGDADAGDALTYCWEQNNSGTAATTQANSRVFGTKTAGPNFRIFPASSSPTRYFPEWSKILAGDLVVTTPSDAVWESCSSVARTLGFTFTVRDNHPGMGQTKTAGNTITVVDAGGAFAITYPSIENTSWDAGSTATVTWNVAGTTGSGINTANVNILLSTDGGATFPTVLASNTPNDGTESITLPSTPSPSCRIMIEAVGNVFFAVSKNIGIGYTFVTTCTTYSNNTALPVPDGVGSNLPGATVSKSINVAATGTVSDVNVTIAGTHTYFWDMVVALSHPDGTLSALLNRNCNQVSTGFNVLFNDGAASSIVCAANLTGTFKPNTVLSAFNGKPMSGTWTLLANDNWNGDTGTIGTWTLEICGATAQLSTSVNQLTDFAIYPNPSSGNFNIQFENHTSNEIKVNVYDMRGRIIFENKYSNQATFNENIQLSNAQAGVYLVSVTDGNQKLVKRLVIE
jgi:subtilisin-like proprotein convertase family protein